MSNELNATPEQDLLMAIFDTIPDSIILIDREDQIVQFNTHAIKLITSIKGANNQFISTFGQKFTEVFPWIPKDLLVVKSRRDKSLESKLLEIEINTIKRFFQIKTNRVNNENQDLYDRIIYIKDLTNDKQAEDDLRKALATKSLLFHVLSHDLITPFNTLMGFTALFKKKYGDMDDKAKKEYIERLCNSSQNLYNMTYNLLEWSRSQTDSITWDPFVFNIGEVIEQTIKPLEEQITVKNIALKLKIKNNLIVIADKKMIETVIRNLYANAIKFTPENGTIKITTSLDDYGILVSISNSGMGIAQKDIYTLFTPEGRIGAKGTYGEIGTGLGLLLCQDFIAKNKGEIWVESVEGQSATFHFVLPKAV